MADISITICASGVLLRAVLWTQVLVVATGQIWSFDASGGSGADLTTTLLVDEDIPCLYFGTATGDIFAVNMTNGKELWRSHIDGVMKRSSAARSGDILVFGSYYPTVEGPDLAVGVDRYTGVVIWSYVSSYGFASSAAVDGLGRAFFDLVRGRGARIECIYRGAAVVYRGELLLHLAGSQPRRFDCVCEFC